MMWLQRIYACNLLSVSLSLVSLYLTLFCNFLVFWSNFYGEGGGAFIREGGLIEKFSKKSP